MESIMVFIVGSIIYGIGGWVGYTIGKPKNRGTSGFWLGLLMGPIGWIIIYEIDYTGPRTWRGNEGVPLTALEREKEFPLTKMYTKRTNKKN